MSQFTKNTREFAAEDNSHAFTIILRIEATMIIFIEIQKIAP